MKESLEQSVITFEPKYPFENTPLKLRDNSPKSEWLIDLINQKSEWKGVWGYVHIVFGYDPVKNGSKIPRGCGNACVSCYFDEKYLASNPSHIQDTLDCTPNNLDYVLASFLNESIQRAKDRFKIDFQTSDYIFRISGDVRGDPAMIDPKTTKRLAQKIKQLYPNIPLFIDTTANQYVKTPDEWRDLGVDTVMVSVNVVDSEAGYRTFHGVGQGRFDNAKKNIHNIALSGVKLGLSFVWGYHPNLPPEIGDQMPQYVRDGQTEQARNDFIQSLGLKPENILQRFWYFSTGTPETWEKIKAADSRYRQLLSQSNK